MKPRIESNSWVMTCPYIDADGDEIWNLKPRGGGWIAVIHLQSSGKMYLKVMKDHMIAGGRVDRTIVADGLRRLAQMVYEERGTRAMLHVKAIEQNAALFQTAKKAGFRRTNMTVREKNKISLVYRYCPRR